EMSTKVDLEWDDADALPPVLDIVTLFVFNRMTDVTLEMVDQKDGGRILDVGCGMGIDASELAKKGNRLVGLEPSHVMLKKANNLSKEQSIDLHLVQGIGETSPFKKRSFQNVICKGALDHFYNPDMAIQEMADAAKHDGKVIISVTNYESLSCMLMKVFNKLRSRIIEKRKVKKDLWDGYGKTKTYRIPGKDTHTGEKTYIETRQWEIPTDHIYKFDYFVLKNALNRHLEVESLVGVSLFWKLPCWRMVMERLPKVLALSILSVSDKIARQFPLFSDVMVSKCRVKNQNRLNDRVQGESDE
ncbi:MAG: class I SAM-dependent methyltransferase, partial [Thermodesulfobacteriota bacterium]|nr:class I SAM-dependent methyltransferase [Thermodesulfobacteriota bacterium]